MGLAKLLEAKPKVDALAALATEDPPVSAADRYATLRRFAPTFLEHVRLKAGTGGAPLLKSLAILRDLNRTGRREIPADAPLPFASKRWKQLVKPGGGEISRRLYETAAVATLRDRLKSGDVWVEGSRGYRRFGDYLLPKDQVAAEAHGLPVTVELGGYLAGRASLLDQRLANFARRLRQGDLVGVTLEGDRLSVTPVKAATPEEARSLDRAIDGLLPRVRITELLREIDALTGFTAMFRDLRSAKYGPEPGLRISTHLSDMHGSFNTRVLSATSSEAPYVLDGLVGRHGGEHYTDTGGATDHVFALCHLLGYRFAPRMRDLQDRRLAIIGSAAGHKTLDPILGRPIRIDLIQENWDDIIRLAASIKAGAVAPSVMLKKLSAFKRQNRLDLALAEVGRSSICGPGGPPRRMRCSPICRPWGGPTSASRATTSGPTPQPPAASGH